MNRILAAATLLAALAPAARADDAALSAQLANLSGTGQDQLVAAYAACVLRMADVEATATMFTDSGWTRADDAETGLVTLAPASLDPVVTLALDATFCDVATEQTGTAAATEAVGRLVTLGGFYREPLAMDPGCPGVELGFGLVAVIQSSGNDPVCQSDTTSAVRFLYQ